MKGRARRGATVFRNNRQSAAEATLKQWRDKRDDAVIAGNAELVKQCETQIAVWQRCLQGLKDGES